MRLAAAYQHAVQAANERSARAFAAPSIPAAGAAAAALPVEAVLAASMARVQRLQTATSAVDRGAAWVLLQAQSQSQSHNKPGNIARKGEDNDSAGSMDVEARELAGADNRLVFTSTSTFSDKMLAVEQDREREKGYHILNLHLEV